MSRITAYALHFTGWSDGELRKLQIEHARVCMSAWAASKKERTMQIIIAMRIFVDRTGVWPAGYELRHKGEVIETGEFSWAWRHPTLENVQRVKTVRKAASHDPA